MIEFDKKIIQLGFGAVGKSFFEKLSKEIKFDKSKYFVISRDKLEYSFFLELGGNINNFIVAEINRDNFQKVFSKYIDEGDFLIDFADGVGTRDFVEWCANRNVMYLNTGETDWDDNWYSIFEENLKKKHLAEQLKENKNVNKYPIVLQHGNNPGLVSHFVKAGLEYIVKKQFRKDEKLNNLLKENKFNELAKELDLKEIHVNDNDYQQINDEFDENKLYSTWSVDSFFFEMLSEATANIGTAENIYTDAKNYTNEREYTHAKNYTNEREYTYTKNDTAENICNQAEYNMLDLKNGFLEFKDLAINKLGKTYYPKGKFKAYLVPHEETITIAKSLEVKAGEEVIYRPTVIFLYSPCDYAIRYLQNSKLNNANNLESTTMKEVKSFDKTSDTTLGINADKTSIIRGFKYPEKAEIVYKEKIKYGTEYVGVLLLGSKFNPVWVGNRIKKNFLYKDKNNSFWQTPTITPVAMSALAASCWMIKNKEKGGIYFPDDINEYNEIINFAEKYISKTIYKTFRKKRIEEELNINLNTLQLKDILISP